MILKYLFIFILLVVIAIILFGFFTGKLNYEHFALCLIVASIFFSVSTFVLAISSLITETATGTITSYYNNVLVLDDKIFEAKDSPAACRILNVGDEVQIEYFKRTNAIKNCELINKSENIDIAKDISEGAVDEKDCVSIDDKTYCAE